MHTRHATDPVLRDDWAERLLAPEARALVADPAVYAGMGDRGGVDVRPFLASNLASLRTAEETVVHGVEQGVGQYVILGAGFDTFALRWGELLDRLRVFEIDHPDVQALKRERIARLEPVPVALPVFVPVDFERDRLVEALAQAGFARERSSVFSWLNTVPYLTRDAVETTLRSLADLAGPGSRLVLNYMPDVEMSEEHRASMAGIRRTTDDLEEPLMSAIAPEMFREMLGDFGFGIEREDDERSLTARYFAGRRDGFAPDIPQRVIVARRREA